MSQDVELVETWECARCGQLNDADARFCKTCGADIVAAEEEDIEKILARAEQKRQENATHYGERIRRELVAVAAPPRFASPPEVGRVPLPSRTPRRTGEGMTALGARFFADGKPALLYVVPPPMAGDTSSEAVERRIRARIPERYQNVTWHNLAELRGPEGLPTVGAVTAEDGRILRGTEAAQNLYDRMLRAPKIVLLGETRSGKTVTSAAALRAELERGNERATWVNATALKDPVMMERALTASFLVLDDLGYELYGGTGGWVSGRREPACKFLAEWEQRRHVRLVISTFMTFDQMAGPEGYGGGAAHRVYEGAGDGLIRFSR